MEFPKRNGNTRKMNRSTSCVIHTWVNGGSNSLTISHISLSVLLNITIVLIENDLVHDCRDGIVFVFFPFSMENSPLNQFGGACDTYLMVTLLLQHNFSDGKFWSITSRYICVACRRLHVCSVRFHWITVLHCTLCLPKMYTHLICSVGKSQRITTHHGIEEWAN